MGLRSEISREFQEKEREILGDLIKQPNEETNTTNEDDITDAEIHGFGWNHFHKKFIDDDL